MKVVRIFTNLQTELKYTEHYLAEEMFKMGHTTLFITSDKPMFSWVPFLKNKEFKPGEENYKFYKIVRLKSFEIANKVFIIELKKMKKLLSAKDYRILHIYGIGNPITFLAILLVMLFNKKVVVIISDHSNPAQVKESLSAKIYYKINNFLYKIFAQHIKKIIVPNKSSYNYLKKRYKIKSIDKLKIIPLGFNNEIYKYNPSKKNNDSKLIIGFAGKINKEKRIDVLINAINKSKYKEKIKAIVCGIDVKNESNVTTNLVNIVKENNLDIEFRPILTPSRLADFYNYIDVAIFPGSISITTIEANGCGTPVVIYNSIEGLEDRVEAGRGVLFKSDIELVNIINNYYILKKNNQINNKFIENETQKYSWGKLANIYISEFENLLNK